MRGVLRAVLRVCCIVVALTSWIAAGTIFVAIATNKLPDPWSWTAVVFFAIAGGFAWVAGRSLGRDPSSFWFGDE